VALTALQPEVHEYVPPLLNRKSPVSETDLLLKYESITVILLNELKTFPPIERADVCACARVHVCACICARGGVLRLVETVRMVEIVAIVGVVGLAGAGPDSASLTL
jgi:hypothetical protein